MARSLITRLRLGRLDPEVVLAGGVFKTDDASFFERLEAGIRATAPRASIHRLTAPPVLGAALIGLDRLAPDGATPAAVEARLRTAARGVVRAGVPAGAVVRAGAVVPAGAVGCAPCRRTRSTSARSIMPSS